MVRKRKPPVRRDMMPSIRVLTAYLYGAALVLTGVTVVYRYKGLKLIEVLREFYLYSRSPMIPKVGYIEIDTIGLFLVALGSVTLMMTFISRNFQQARNADFVFIVVVNVFSIFYFLNAYICDDAFISFRTVDNFIHGYGLRWNTVERVQTYTNPLWVFLMIAVYGPVYRLFAMEDITKIYFVSMILSYLVSLSAVLFLTSHMIRSNRRAALLVLLTVLFSSRAFVEYTSSGLENPLTYLLIVLFYVRYFSGKDQRQPVNLVLLLSIASLAFLNRQDTVLLFAFPVASLCISALAVHRVKAAGLLAAGFSPAWGWVLFSMIYYGFPFPNSYYAKLGLKPASVVWKQGVNYFFSVCISDPLTVFAIFIALLATVFRRDNRNLMTGMSLLVSVCYVISTGGDFMGGRFMSAPFLVAVLLVALGIHASRPNISSNQPRQKRAGNISHGQVITLVSKYRVHIAVAALIIYTIVIPLSPAKTPLQSSHLSNKQYGTQVFALPNSLRNIYMNTNYYYSSNPLFYSKDGFPFGNLIFHLLKDCRHCRQMREESVAALIGGGGVNGFCRGPLQQLIDPQAITDPLLARLPLPDLTGGFVPGHFVRPVPDGLLESYITNQNMVKDPKLREYYEKLFTVVRGPIFSLKRLRYIIELNIPWNRRYAHPYS